MYLFEGILYCMGYEKHFFINEIVSKIQVRLILKIIIKLSSV